jgi:hypothetical protein
MWSMRTRLARIVAAVAVVSGGLVGYDAVTQVASAQPPPVISTGYAAYPPPGSIPAGCADGPGFLQGYRAFIQRAGAPAVDPFIDPGAGVAGTPAASMRRFEGQIQVGDQVVIRWTSWAPNCASVPVSFPLKGTIHNSFNLSDDQALVRVPNGPFIFPFCHSNGDGCDTTPATSGFFQLTNTIPQPHVVCGFQLDTVIGGPLETIGPHGSYYQTQNRIDAQAAGLGTFNTSPPNMLIDAANGGVQCVPDQRIVIDKEWVGTGANPPTNVPPEFLLTVTSSNSKTDPTVISTATCNVSGGVFTCSYVDTAAPGVPQGGLLVNVDSLLTVTETGFPGNTVNITFPVGLASGFVHCAAAGTPCLLSITNTPPPPPPTTTMPPTTAPETTPPPTDTTPTTLPESITLPPTGSSGPAPMTIIAIVLLPVGAALVWFTRRRRADET